jgi:hypothetical protein
MRASPFAGKPPVDGSRSPPGGFGLILDETQPIVNGALAVVKPPGSGSRKEHERSEKRTRRRAAAARRRRGCGAFIQGPQARLKP